MSSPGPNLRAVAWIGAIALVIYAIGFFAADPDVRTVAGPAFAFQLACWVVGLSLIARKNPGTVLRVGDPGVLIMLWFAAYLLYPSLIWYMGGQIPHESLFSIHLYISLFWMHGFFMIGFAVTYVLISKPVPATGGRVDADRLPSGWPLLLVSLLPAVLGILGRILVGGGLLVQGSYGDVWYAEVSSLLSAQEAGGLSYIAAQLKGKAWFYLAMMQGIGAGLLLTTAWATGKRRWRTLLLVMGLVILFLIVGSGGRSAVLMVVIISLALSDLLAGPVRLRYLIALAIVGLLAFEFMAFFRTYRDEGFDQAMGLSVDALRRREVGELSEFPSMLTKEAVAVRFFSEVGPDGPVYLVQSVLALVPSQFVPGKLAWQHTSRIILDLLLGPSAYYLGKGTAGATVADGYRLAGIIGIPMLGAILGLGWGLVQRWAVSGWQGASRPSLLQLALLATSCAWTFNAVRGSLSTFFVTVIYYVVVPWLVISAIALKDRTSVWIRPFPVHSRAIPTGIDEVAVEPASVEPTVNAGGFRG